MRVLVLPVDASENVAELIPGAHLLDLPQLDSVERIILSFMPPVAVLSSPIADQARRNAESRTVFLIEVASLDAQGLADLAGSRAGNRRATASRWQAEGLCFSIEHEGRQLFPAFQFDALTARPRPAVAAVITELLRVGLVGWSLAQWWTTPHDILGWRRPIDDIVGAPDRVIGAAQADARTRG